MSNQSVTQNILHKALTSHQATSLRLWSTYSSTQSLYNSSGSSPPHRRLGTSQVIKWYLSLYCQFVHHLSHLPHLAHPVLSHCHCLLEAAWWLWSWWSRWPPLMIRYLDNLSNIDATIDNEGYLYGKLKQQRISRDNVEAFCTNTPFLDDMNL